MKEGLYHNKYRIASIRATWWNYAWHAAYFITICTKNRDHYFGVIKDGKMELSKAGLLADVFWHEIKHHSSHVELDAFVVMPNHIHGILIMDGIADTGQSIIEAGQSFEEQTGQSFEVQTGQSFKVQTGHALSQQSDLILPALSQQSALSQQRFRNQGKNTVSAIIGSYKSAVTKHANRLGIKCGWQERFYDNIIRDDAAFRRIANYIERNVIAWDEDKFYGGS